MPKPVYLVEGAPIAYERLPVGYMADGVRTWLEQGVVAPRSFLSYMISGDLFNTIGKADEANSANLRAWCQWWYTAAPAGSYGSVAACSAWAAHRGLAGLAAHDEGIKAMKRVQFSPTDPEPETIQFPRLAPVFEAPGIATDEAWTWTPTGDRVLTQNDVTKIAIGRVVYRGKPLGE